MKKKIPLFAFPVLLALFAAPLPVISQTPPQPPPSHENVELLILFPKEKTPRRIIIELYETVAPQTVANFKELIRRKFYQGQLVHRAIPEILVQMGDPLSRSRSPYAGTGGPGYTLPAEIQLPVRAGSVAMARLDDVTNLSLRSNGSQFFIALRDLPELNGKYTVFGKVIEGMDVLTKISNTRTDTNDFPIQNYRITAVNLVSRGAIAGSSEAIPAADSARR